MIPILTNEQLQAIHSASDAGPVPVVDPTTDTAYVLIRADIFEQMRSLLDDFDIRETYAAQEAVAADAGWNDPQLDIYNDYDTHRPQP